MFGMHGQMHYASCCIALAEHKNWTRKPLIMKNLKNNQLMIEVIQRVVASVMGRFVEGYFLTVS